MKEKINVDSAFQGRRDRFFARSAGTMFRSEVSDGRTEIAVYDEIGFWGVTATDFRSRLRDMNGPITVKINSPGGDVMDGIAIYNELVAYKGDVRVEITGLAASIASVIAMAGNDIAIAQNGFFMVHNAWCMAVGNRHDLTDAAAILKKLDGAIALTYAATTGKGVRTLGQLMDDETWMTAQEALDLGFATEILTKKDMQSQARFDLSVFSRAPEALRWNEEDDQPETEEDIERVLMRDAGRTRSQARALIRDIRAGNTTRPDAKRDAGLKLDGIAAALAAVKADLQH